MLDEESVILKACEIQITIKEETKKQTIAIFPVFRIYVFEEPNCVGLILRTNYIFRPFWSIVGHF